MSDTIAVSRNDQANMSLALGRSFDRVQNGLVKGLDKRKCSSMRPVSQTSI